MCVSICVSGGWGGGGGGGGNREKRTAFGLFVFLSAESKK